MTTQSTEFAPGEPFRGARPSGKNRPARTALTYASLALFGAVAAATAREGYPRPGDGAVEARIAEWKSLIPPLAAELCTGAVARAGVESVGDAIGGTPVVPGWRELVRTGPDGPAAIESHVGGDTDQPGNDSYLYVKLVGIRANLFCRVILEAEDGASSAWSIRYKGEEQVRYANGPAESAETYEISNPWAIGWTRRIVDFDARAGQYDEDKAVDQSFAVRCELVDGSSRGDGAQFHRVVPRTEGATTSLGLKLKPGVKIGDATAAEYGGELGFEAGSSTTYDTMFHEQIDRSAVDLHGIARVAGVVPCPWRNHWTMTTYFDCDLSIHDHADVNGDMGSRQELTVTVLHHAASFVVSGCRECGARTRALEPADPVHPIEPTDPPTGGECPPVPPDSGFTPGCTPLARSATEPPAGPVGATACTAGNR